MQIINIIAILLSPVVAVCVSIYLQRRHERIERKQKVFEILMSTRHSIAIDEQVRALNMIDAVFFSDAEVRKLWHEYFDMLHNEGLNNELGWKTRQKKFLELLTEMAKSLGYGMSITHLDVDRVYNPVGLAEFKQRGEAIANELLRVLKASGGLQIIAKAEGDQQPKQQ